MNGSDTEPWCLEMIGAATMTAPSGEQVTLCARLCWMMTQEHTLRFLIYVDGLAMPIIKVVGPQAGRHVIAKSAVDAFRELLDQLPSLPVPGL